MSVQLIVTIACMLFLFMYVSKRQTQVVCPICFGRDKDHSQDCPWKERSG